MQKGNTQDFAELATSNRITVFRFALASLRNRDDAEDVTQDCLLRAYLAWERFRGDCSPQTWLIGIANNLIRDARRGLRKNCPNGAPKSSSSPLDRSVRDPRSSPEQQHSAKEELTIVWRVMERNLSPNQRRVFFLRFMTEMSFAEIEAATGIANPTVRVHLSRAARSVRSVLNATIHRSDY